MPTISRTTKRLKRMQATIERLQHDLATLHAHRQEPASAQRILAGLRKTFTTTTQQAQQARYPHFNFSHEQLLRRTFALSINPFARRILEIPRDLLLQSPYPFQTDAPAELELLTAFWDDPINQMQSFKKQITFNYGLYGEQCFTVFTNPINKKLRLGYIHPFLIEQTIVDPDNDRVVIGVKLYADGRSDQILTTILSDQHNEEDFFSPETQELRRNFSIIDPHTHERIQRKCFLFQSNPYLTPASLQYGASLRGQPDLLALYDWILATDDVLSSMIERAAILSKTLWTLQVQGGNLADGDPLNLDVIKAKYGQPPKSWEVMVTNERMTWGRQDGNLGNSDMVDLLKAIQMYVVAGSGYSETWLMGGRNSNRASAESMEYPALMKLTSREEELLSLFKTLLGYQCVQANIPATFKMVATPLKEKNQQALATAMKTLSDSMQIAQTAGWITQSDATAVYRQLMQDFGVELTETTSEQAPLTVSPDRIPNTLVTPMMGIGVTQ